MLYNELLIQNLLIMLIYEDYIHAGVRRDGCSDNALHTAPVSYRILLGCDAFYCCM